MAIQAEDINRLIAGALSAFKTPSERVSGKLRPEIFASTKEVTEKISEIWLTELSKDPRFMKGDPVLLGSWAKGQLLPKSDLDFGFFSDTEDTRALLRELQKLPFQVRGRILDEKEIAKWPVPERLSFLEAKPLTEEATRRSADIKNKILKNSALEKKRMVKELLKDRQMRHAGGPLFENVLEPQMKLGKGGLRDLQQCDHIFNLFEGLLSDKHPQEILLYYRWFFLSIRLRLHQMGAKDFVQAALQPDLADFFGFKDFRDFMRELQKALSRVTFYSEFIFVWSLSSNKTREATLALRFNSAESLLKSLESDPSILTQYQVRRQMDSLVTESWKKNNQEFIESTLLKYFGRATSDESLIALVQSRLMAKLDDRFRDLVGYNQHDQYHAFTADIHILNLLLGFKRMLKKPARLGVFTKYVKDLSARDEAILALTCYYHDLAKGQGGDHEALGEKWVLDDATKRGRAESLTTEIAWLVRYHLEFSKASFKEDPRAESTWKRLLALDLNPARIKRLALFTVLDIEATNPKAWTPWKEKLLFALTQELLEPQRVKTLKQLQELEERAEVSGLEVKFAESVGLPRLKRDLLRIKAGKAGEGYLIEKVRGGYWIRYFEAVDRPGILVSALKALFAVGASVQEAWVFTLPGIGVYDWFFVESSLKADVFEKRLSLVNPEKLGVPDLKWKDVQFENIDGDRLRLILRGKDQRGILLSTVEKIFKSGGEVLSARIQTWGEQAEDQIMIRMQSDNQKTLKQLLTD